MQKEYTQEQRWEIYDNLPEKLKESIFSPKTADIIFDACSTNTVEDKRLSKIAGQVGDVLLGILPVKEFKLNLNLDFDLKSNEAKDIFEKINAKIFTPLEYLLNGHPSVIKITVNPSKTNLKPSLESAPNEPEKLEGININQDSQKVQGIESSFGLTPMSEKEIDSDSATISELTPKIKQKTKNLASPKAGDTYREPIGQS